MSDVSLFIAGGAVFVGLLAVLGMVADWWDRREQRDARRRNRRHVR